MSDGGWGGNCGGGGGWNWGGWGGFQTGCDNGASQTPAFVTAALASAGQGACPDGSPLGSGISDGCWGHISLKGVGESGKVGSGATYSTKGAGNSVTPIMVTQSGAKPVVEGNSNGDAIIGSGVSHDTFVVGFGIGDQLSDAGAGGTFNSLIAGDGAFDTLTITAGTNNLMQAGNGAGDVVTLGSGSNNLLIAGNGMGDSVTLGSGDHNTLQVGNATVAPPIGMPLATNSDTVAVTGVGNFDLLVSSDGSHSPAVTMTISSGNNNVIEAGGATGDFLYIVSGNNNTLSAGGGGSDQLTIDTGDNNTLLAGNGAGDTLTMTSGSHNILAAGNGNGDLVQFTSGATETTAFNTLAVGGGNGDVITWSSGDNNSAFAGGGAGDNVNWQSGSNALVQMGDGAGDQASWQDGSCNAVTLGNGDGDTINFNTNGDGSFNTLVVGNGNGDLVGVFGNNNLLQCGNGNGDVLGSGFNGFNGPGTFLTGDAGVPGDNNVLVAGSGNGDILFGAAGNDTMIAGGGLGSAAYSASLSASGTEGTWSGTWGDILNGGGFINDGGAATTFDAYVLNSQGGSLAQDTSADLGVTIDPMTGALSDPAIIVNLGGNSQSQGFGGGGDDDEENNYGGGNNYNNNNYGGGDNQNCGGGGGGQQQNTAAINGVNVTDFAFTAGSMSASGGATDNAGGELWTFTNSFTNASVTLDLFGQFSLTGFAFASDANIENVAATWGTNGIGGGSLVKNAGDTGTVITYQAAPANNPCGGGGEDDDNNDNNGGCNTGGGDNTGGGYGGTGGGNGGGGYQQYCGQESQWLGGCGH